MGKDRTELGGGRTWLRLRKKLCCSSIVLFVILTCFSFHIKDPVIYKQISEHGDEVGCIVINGVPKLE